MILGYSFGFLSENLIEKNIKERIQSFFSTYNAEAISEAAPRYVELWEATFQEAQVFERFYKH